MFRWSVTLLVTISATTALQWQSLFYKEGEHKIVKDSLLATLPKVSEEFRISFMVKPYRYTKPQYSVLHMTTGSASSRVPEISIGRTQLQVSMRLNRKTVTKNLKPTPALNQWTQITLEQIKNSAGKYVFTATVGSKSSVFTYDNKVPEEYAGVKVFAGNSWKRPAYGHIKDLLIESVTGGATESIGKPIVKQRTAQLSIPKLEKEWSLSFEVKLRAYMSGVRNIVHVTQGTSGTKKIPSVSMAMIGGNRFLQVIYGLTKKVQKKMTKNLPPPALDTWTKVEVGQELIGSKYFYTIFIDDTKVCSELVTSVKELTKVNVFASSRSMNAQSGMIRGLAIRSGPPAAPVQPGPPVQPAWGVWTAWTSCSQSCGKGSRSRSRECSGAAGSCQGDAREEDDCIIAQCPVDAHWSPWSSWGDCSVHCGEGTQERTRICIKEEGGGMEECQGKPAWALEMEDKPCSQAACTTPSPPAPCTPTWSTSSGSPTGNEQPILMNGPTGTPYSVV